MTPSGEANSVIDPELVWRRIVAHAGETFQQIRGKAFKYAVTGGGATIEPSTTRWKIPKSHIIRALEFVPLVNTVPLQSLMGPSYIYAVLTDRRIRQSDW